MSPSGPFKMNPLDPLTELFLVSTENRTSGRHPVGRAAFSHGFPHFFGVFPLGGYPRSFGAHLTLVFFRRPSSPPYVCALRPCLFLLPDLARNYFSFSRFFSELAVIKVDQCCISAPTPPTISLRLFPRACFTISPIIPRFLPPSFHVPMPSRAVLDLEFPPRHFPFLRHLF